MSERLVARPIVGEPVAVETAVETARRAGRLVHADPPRPYGDGLVVVEAVLREPRLRSPRPPRRAVWLTAAGLGGLVALAGLVWALHAAWVWAVAHWATVLGVLALGWLVAYGLGRLGACPGVHCPGCRHR